MHQEIRGNYPGNLREKIPGKVEDFRKKKAPGKSRSEKRNIRKLKA
jgi:hypothetical protein